MTTTADELSSSILPRREVIYCGACGMPPEYCEYGPDFESHCLPWLQKHHFDLYEQLYSNRTVSTTTTTAPKTEKPTQPWTLEQRLTAFYEQYVPEKVESVPGLLEKYAGKEEQLFNALVKKYGPEPDDPYYCEDEDEEDVDTQGQQEPSSTSKKRRGVGAKKSVDSSTVKVIVQKVSQKKKRTLTVVTGMESLPNVKLKDVAKTFSKTFAGSSSVKDKSIIVQGDHVYDAAELVVDKFHVPETSVFLDLDGEIVPFK